MGLPLAKPVVSPLLVGRTAQLALLRQAVEASAAGQGQTILIAGEAGIGKSRLLGEARKQAAQREFLILEGHCFEPDRSLPYAPLIDLLRARFAGRPPDDVTRELGATAPELVTLLPELTAHMPDLGPTAVMAPEQEKHRLFHALAQYLAGLAAAHPILLVVEDLHWSDDTSLEVLQRLARQVASFPLLLLLTYRTDEPHPTLSHVLAELDRGRLATEIVLSRLTEADIDAMLQAIFALDRPVRAEFLLAIDELCEGNPFFIEEVLTSLVASGDIVHTADGWERKPIEQLRIPRTIHDAVRRRSARLSTDARHVLALSAVAGRRFDVPVLQAMTGQDEPELLRCLKELIAAQLVVEESGARFAFRHALTRQAVYRDLLAIERRALHQAVAEAMERIYADALNAHAGDLAYHYNEAQVWPKALEFARSAGEQAMTLYAPRAAIEHFTRALNAAGHLLAAPPIDVCRGRGLAFEILGDFEQAREDLERSLALARSVGDERAEWQALLDLGLLWASRDYARTGEYDRQALELARRMDDPATLGRSLNRLGNWYVNVEQPLRGRQYHEEALGIFEELTDRRGIAETLDLLGMARCCGGDLRGSIATYDRAAALFRERDDRPGLVMSLALLASRAGDYHFDPLALDGNEFAPAVAAGEEARAIAHGIAWRSGEAFAGVQLAQSLGTRGQYDRALTIAHEAERIARAIEHRQWLAFANEVLGRLYLDLLALPTARQHLEQALQLARETNALIWCHAASGALISVCVQHGDLAQAEAVLAAVPGPGQFPQSFGQRLFAGAHVELALARRQPGRALHLADQLLASLSPDGREGQCAIAPPHLGRLRGEALAALGRVAEAEAALQTDLAAASERGCLPTLWRLHAAIGHFYRGGGQRAAADRQFAAAGAIIEDLVAKVPDDTVRSTFQRQALAMLPSPRPPTRLRSAKLASGGLTRRERDVAALIAEHKTNRQIAQALFIGEGTVATHVGHILTKLNVASRSEIAAWAREHGMAPRR